MMLLEHSSKKILSENYVNVPKGVIFNKGEVIPKLEFPCIAKAQVPFGKRGKSGLVKEIQTAGEFQNFIAGLFSKPIKGYSIERVLVEEKKVIKMEFYLSFSINRDMQTFRLIFSKYGGTDIESVNLSDIFSFDIDPLIGLQEYMMRRVVTVFLGDQRFSKKQYEEVVVNLERLYGVFCKYQATLLEINPLALTGDNTLCALDAKLVIDDNAEEVQGKIISLYDESYTFGSKLLKYGVNASKLDGNIAIITSGAGLMMATVDLIAVCGGSAGACIDLGGAVFRLTKEAHIFSEVLQEAMLLKPKVILFNAFFQLARCDDLAQAIKAAFEKLKVDIPVILRLKGMYEVEAAAILSSLGNFFAEDELGVSCKKAVKYAQCE